MTGYWRPRKLRRVSLQLLSFLSVALAMNRGLRAQEKPRVVRVFVALADNEHQGIVPVPKALGNGEDPGRNLYWGAAFGVRTYFKKSSEWKEIAVVAGPNTSVLERSVFLHRQSGTYLVADGYRGREIKAAIEDFYRAAAGQAQSVGEIRTSDGTALKLPANTDLAVYVGHDGLMDFPLEQKYTGNADGKRAAIVLACASKSFFEPGLRATRARPLLWTTGLMAPEAYTLEAAVEGWIAGESAAEIRGRAAKAYASYQKISVSAAERLFASGW